MSVFIQRQDPITFSKERINEDDLVNPVLPNCPKHFMIIDGDIVREMTQEEKDSRWKPVTQTPKEWCESVILQIETLPPYYVGRGLEEQILASPQEQQERLFYKIKIILEFKAKLRLVIATNPDVWESWETSNITQSELQEELNEIISWA